MPNSSKDILVFTYFPTPLVKLRSPSVKIISYRRFFTSSFVKNISIIALFSNSVNYSPFNIGIVRFVFLLFFTSSTHY